LINLKRKKSLKQAVYDWLNEIDIPNLDLWIEHFLQVKNEMGSSVETHDSHDNSAHNFFIGTEDYDPQIYKARKVAIYLMSYRDHPKWSDYAKVLQSLLKIEQAFVLFKYRHPRMIEMVMIGRRVGTGGSSGVAYLDSTTLPQFRIFFRLD